MTKKMRILHTIGSYFPNVGGAQEVVKQVSEQLARRGNIVTVATAWQSNRMSREINGVHLRDFKISGSIVHGLSGEVESYKDFLIKGDFDVMMNYAAQQWATDLVFPILNQLSYCKVLAPCGFSGLFEPRYKDYFLRMPNFLRQFDHLIFHSNKYRDIEYAKANGISDLTVIPNGASEKEFSRIDPTFRMRYGIPEDIPLLLTVGSHTGLKGHELVMKAFYRSKIGEAVLVIIGNQIPDCIGCTYSCEILSRFINLSSFGKKKVFLLNPPRQDVVAAYHSADLFVFGSKIECSPLVLFEAMASRTPFISLAVGNAKEIAEWGRCGIVIPTIKRPNGIADASPDIMAKAIEQLINNSDDRQKLAEAGYIAWKNRFTWEKISLEYERVYRSLLDLN